MQEYAPRLFRVGGSQHVRTVDHLRDTMQEVVSKSPREMQEHLIRRLYEYTGTEEINDDYTTMIVKFRQ